MDDQSQVFRIHNPDDFNLITKGIKVARCMQSRSSYVPETEKVLSQLEDLVVSDSLCCSFCNTMFEDKIQQRHHYKLDWHCYNLKQHLNGLKSISEDSFNSMVDEGVVSSLSGSETESENEDEAGTSETSSSLNDQSKSESANKDGSAAPNEKSKKAERYGKGMESVSDSSDTECNDKTSKQSKLLAIASRHSKVFFENGDGNIFSIYRCLLHHKKDIPEVDNEMVAHALNSGKKTTWTIIMVGGGHFAAAVFRNGEPIVHKTFHCYTVRAKQGFAQNSRATGNHPKSAGASLRRYNKASLIQHVQEILELWSTHISDSSLILYRAVGPYNRTILFGGKNPPLDKNDSRLRPLPFPTRRATFSEVKRVYDILSTMEIYGSASNFTDCFPISPRQPIRKKVAKPELMNETLEGDAECSPNTSSSQESDKVKIPQQSSPERQHRNSRSHIDRAKPRKSPIRPLPDIVARLAQSSSSEESELNEKHNSANLSSNDLWIEQVVEIDFNEHLVAFQDTVPRYMKNKKARRQKKKVVVKKDAQIINEVLLDAKIKLWDACKLGDNDLLSSTIDNLLAEVKKNEELMEQNKNEVTIELNSVFVNMNDVIKLVNDTNEEGNTMLHLAALGGHLKLVWLLLDIGSDPCNKNKKLQTPYAVANNKETRNEFRRFMGANPEKFNYRKSQIPGPLTDEIEQEQTEKKKQRRKVKRMKEKVKKVQCHFIKQIEEQIEADKRQKLLEEQREAEEMQKFLNLSDKEKRALFMRDRMLSSGGYMMWRCFQCAEDMSGHVPFEYNVNLFCSMSCLKTHRFGRKILEENI